MFYLESKRCHDWHNRAHIQLRQPPKGCKNSKVGTLESFSRLCTRRELARTASSVTNGRAFFKSYQTPPYLSSPTCLALKWHYITKIVTIWIFRTTIYHKVASGVYYAKRISGSPEVILRVNVPFIYKPQSSPQTL